MKVLPPITDDDKMLAGLPYVVWPIGSGFILLSRKKEDPFLCYHAVQALLSGALMAVAILAVVFFLFLGFRVLPGSASYAPAVISLGTLVGGGGAVVVVFLTALFLGWRATEGEMLRLPFLGDFAEQKMLDQTGMTRRQFQEMCDAAFVEQQKAEDIPFPEAPQQPEAPLGGERAIDRLEAARQARASLQQREEEEVRTHQQRELQLQRELQERERKQQELQQREALRQREIQVQREMQERERQQREMQQRQAQQRAAQGQSPGSMPQRRPQISPAQQSQSSQPQPVVKEVDLIGHYKEKRVGNGPQGAQPNDVLKNWLSSVDQEQS